MNCKYQSSESSDPKLQRLMESFILQQKQAQTQAQHNQQRRMQQQQPYINYYPQHMAQSYNPKYYPTQMNQKAIDIKLEKIQFSLIQNPAINQTIVNDNQELVLRMGLGQRLLFILASDRNLQKDDIDPTNVYQNSQMVNAQKLKIELRVDDHDEMEVNGTEFTITILTRQPIKQAKAETQKKNQLGLNQEYLTGKQVQIIIRFHKEWYLKYQTILKAKQILEQIFRSLTLPKLKLVQFDQIVPQPIPPPLQQQDSYSNFQSASYDRKQQKIEKTMEMKSNVAQEEEQEEKEVQFTEKDLLNFFPLITEEYVQKQKDLLDKKVSTTDEKIKRLFDEVRIKQFKSTQYNQDKKVYKCPYHKCSKNFSKPFQLKSHLKKCHQKLSEIDFTIDDNGDFKFNEKVLDYCLLLWKVYPNFVKSIINEMRQRKEQIPM